MSKAEEQRKKVIKHGDENNEFVTAEDGFVYWWPDGLNGLVASHHLRWIADELDKRNERWNKVIETIDKAFDDETNAS